MGEQFKKLSLALAHDLKLLIILALKHSVLPDDAVQIFMSNTATAARFCSRVRKAKRHPRSRIVQLPQTNLPLGISIVHLLIKVQYYKRN
jgi:hypothetical protein